MMCFPSLLSAEITLKTPAADETISTVAPLLRSFLSLPFAERRKIFSDRPQREALFKVRDAQPFLFSWRCTEGEVGPFTLSVSTKEDFSEPSSVLVLAPTNQEKNACEALLANFEIGRTYYWRVTGQNADGGSVASGTGRFFTDSQTPRLLVIPNIGNVRDLGGYQGLDGKVVRQGMIFRSAGLNENSPDFEKKENVAENRIGATKLTPASIAYINKVLCWKTELDLRRPGEVASMKESPAGPGVQWVHRPSKAYGGIFGEDGSCTGPGPEAMTQNFRLFTDPANYPINFHCIAGADRTGSLAFVLLGVLGVAPDAIAKDWEITASNYIDPEKMFDGLAANFGKFGAKEDPLARKVEAYLHKIGITPQEIAAFRGIMLEE